MARPSLKGAIRVLQEELEAERAKVKMLVGEIRILQEALEAQKGMELPVELEGLREFLGALYKESDNGTLRTRLQAWMKVL